MKTIEIQLYKFDELSESAKEAAINWWRESAAEDSFWADECFSSIKAFCLTFGVTFKNAEYGYNSDINYRLGQIDDNVLALSGSRARTYILNNFGSVLFESKPIGEYPYKRRSKISVIDRVCPFTGVYFDEELLKPVRDFIIRPVKGYTYEEVLRDCMYAGSQALQTSYEYETGKEAAIEGIRANEYDFTEDGKIY